MSGKILMYSNPYLVLLQQLNVQKVSWYTALDNIPEMLLLHKLLQLELYQTVCLKLVSKLYIENLNSRNLIPAIYFLRQSRVTCDKL